MARLIEFDRLTPAPWKNGGGSTTELALCPPGAGLDDFDWRLSVASISRSGAFSIFNGIERTLVLLVGDALALSINGAPAVQLSAAAALIGFAGEAHVQASVNAPSRDFNVMTRRSTCRHNVRLLGLPVQLEHGAGITVLFLARGAQAIVQLGAESVTLRRFDALLLDSDDADDAILCQVHGGADARLLVAEIVPA